MNRYICIHGHFYQPPRENPWWEDIEFQDSAYPYHDWNRRITTECYGPNTASRILGSDRKIIDIVNNYANISFNFGPTLLAWMQNHEPEIYKGIITADKISLQKFSGHGSAIAQVYNHMIMPLVNSRDKRTQVIWGIKDFESRFNRKPEGMWLAEAAVDLETLDILAEYGIKFTILGPRQAKRVKKFEDKRWKNVVDSKIDPKMPYLCRLPSGRTITIFFYDGPVSNDIAFSGLLNSGEGLANRLVSVFNNSEQSQLVHAATDGETYGHHHVYGEMALSYCLYYIESMDLAKITIYGEYLEKFPPTYEVEIFENSSWSCSHGVERWRSSCGCKLGAFPGWQQDWRAPLREAMDWLRDKLVNVFQEHMGGLVNDPWQVRDDYIDVIWERKVEKIELFISKHAKKELSQEEKVKLLKLLEMQRHAMLMYTSCGWFFDDISGIETIQIIQYAARAIQLAQDVSGLALEKDYLKLLKKAPSNIPEIEDGAHVFSLHVKRATIEAVRVGVHYAVTALFKDYPDTAKIHAYTIVKQAFERQQVENQKLVFGQVFVRSDITLEEDSVCFVSLYSEDHDIIAGANKKSAFQSWDNIFQEIKDKFMQSDITEVMRLVDNYFSDHQYSLQYLFKDEQRQVLREIFKQSQDKIELSFRKIYEEYSSLLQAVESAHIPMPRYLAAVLDLVFDTDIRKALEADEPDFNELNRLIKEFKRWSLQIDRNNLSFIASKQINKFMNQWAKNIDDLSLLEKIINFLKIIEGLTLNVKIWRVQNVYFAIGKEHLHAKQYKLTQADEHSIKWVNYFNELGNYLKVKVEEI
ncbi:MAG: DUF3536 domain-containing protein [Candidatus Omnitrophota bacterium]